MADSAIRTISFDRKGALIPLSVTGIPLILAVAAIAKEPSAPGIWQCAVAAAGLVTIFAAYLASFKITLFADRLVYRRFPGREQTVPFADIRRVEVQIGFGRGGLVALALHRRSSGEPVTINMKPFSRQGLAALMQAIKTNVPGVEMDASAQRLLKGDVQPVIAQTIQFMTSWRVLVYLLLVALVVALLKAWFRR